MHIADHIAARAIPLTLNAVMHRENINDLVATMDMAERLGARRIEVACVQFHGWALQNRTALQPTRAQVDRAKDIIKAESEKRLGRLVFDFVPPDYYSDFPKACMGGWGSTGLNVTPNGTVLPCHAAETIPTLTFANVKESSLSEIWYHGSAFNAYRGTDWMPALCQTCTRRDIDFGGCRCQAMALLGDPDAVDPVCKKSPDRPVVDRLVTVESDGLAESNLIYRRM